jgi:uncharacterized SAM-binding protein YcdF (DUF218 family)
VASDRERFLAAVYTGPLLEADAIVVLAGEDAKPRLDVGAQLLRSGGAQRILLLGGRHEPPRHVSASSLVPHLHGMGIHPDRIIADDGPQHTREQATRLVEVAKEQGWGRVLLVASAYHIPRSLLTIVKAITEADALDALHVVPAPASHAPWFKAPAGADGMRLDLLDDELLKVTQYAGHVASYADGLAYLGRWEGK